MQQHSCGHFGDPNMTLCEPLAKLKGEHPALLEEMDQFAQLAEKIVQSNGEELTVQLQKLRQLVSTFVDNIERHSGKEEDGLFHIMARHIGRETGPIAVMEYEHNEAKKNLKAFMEATDRDLADVSLDEGKLIAGYAHQAQLILVDHFMKEENVLFPMAEQLLSVEEKEELAAIVG